MKQNKDITMTISSEEEELIKAIRNYTDSYPDGHPRLLEYAVMLFDNLTDPFKDK